MVQKNSLIKLEKFIIFCALGLVHGACGGGRFSAKFEPTFQSASAESIPSQCVPFVTSTDEVAPEFVQGIFGGDHQSLDCLSSLPTAAADHYKVKVIEELKNSCRAVTFRSEQTGQAICTIMNEMDKCVQSNNQQLCQKNLLSRVVESLIPSIPSPINPPPSQTPPIIVKLPVPPSWEAVVSTTALDALSAVWAEKVPGYCSRWVRQVFEHAFPNETLFLDSTLFGSSAIETAQLWRNAGLSRSLNLVLTIFGGLQSGDVIFQEFGSNGFGHVGVIVQTESGLMVAENSSGRGGATDARVLSPLSSFGTVTSVGRYRGF